MHDDIPVQVEKALSRIRSHVRETPLVRSAYYSEAAGCDVHLKLENQQHTGSFKVRGAFNTLLSLEERRRAGCVAASTGNHGAAFAYAAARLGVPGIVFVPEAASPTKVAAIRRLGAEVRVFGEDAGDTEIHARRFAHEEGREFISPYNDPRVIAGQGTIGAEIEARLEDVDVVLASVGGGGLIAGVAGYLKRGGREVTVVGCQPEASPVMSRCVAAGRLLRIDSAPTLSDATAGGVEPGAVTFPICKDLVDEWVLVSERAIGAAIRTTIDAEHMLVEGSAGVALAALLETGARWKGKRVAVVVCGANIGTEALRAVL